MLMRALIIGSLSGELGRRADRDRPWHQNRQADNITAALAQLRAAANTI